MRWPPKLLPLDRGRVSRTSTRAASCGSLALVDPDNRRPVDFARRRELLTDPRGPPAEADRPSPTGRREALGHPPGADPAPRPARALSPATCRSWRRAPQQVMPWPSTAAARSPSSRGCPVGLSRAGGWRGHRPAAARRRAGVDALTGAPGTRAAMPCSAELLATYPVALLVRRRPDGDPTTASTSWAPVARTASGPRSVGDAHAVSDDRRPSGDGWWTVDRRRSSPGERRLRLLARRGRRAAARPAFALAAPGVHGPLGRTTLRPSRGPTGTGRAPAARGVIYELHVGTFTREGTFAAAAERLDHLRRFRSTHVELMPVATFPAPGLGLRWRRSCSLRTSYGTPEGSSASSTPATRAESRCPRRGLQPPRAGRELPRASSVLTSPTATHPWGEAVNLDGPGSDEVRRFFIDNARMWLEEFHCDGLRLDAVHALHDQSARALHRAARARGPALSERLRRPLVLIAESDLNDPRLIAPSEHGFALDAQWSDDFHHALHALLTGERNGYYTDFGSLADLARTLADGTAFSRPLQPLPPAYHGRSLGRRCRGLGCSGIYRLTIRSAIARSESASASSSRPAGSSSARRSCSLRRSCRCSSRARSGPRAPPSSTSPISRISSHERCAKAGATSSARSDAAVRGARPAGRGDVPRLGAGLVGARRGGPRRPAGDLPTTDRLCVARCPS